MRDKPVNVVCIHGAGGGGWEWAIWARVLAADLQPVAAGLEATRYADYRDQVLAWVGVFDRVRPLVLLGASMGGLLALDVANAVGASALVLINPLPPAPFASTLPPREWPDRVPWGRDRSLAGTRAAMPDVDDAACLYAFRRWRDESGAVLREACAGVAIERPRMPTALLTSGADSDVPPDITVELGRWLGATMSIVGGASHVGPLLGARAATLAPRMADWLDDGRQALKSCSCCGVFRCDLVDIGA